MQYIHRDTDVWQADPVGHTIADTVDNALANTTIGVYNTECVRKSSPFRIRPLRALTDLEDSTSAGAHRNTTNSAATIAEHLARDPAVTKAPATSTIWRILKRLKFGKYV